eukprot:scaffold3136_cov75-Skeletonema_marinoi.AAC.2
MGLARAGGGGHSGSEVACIPGDNLVDTYDAIRRCWRKDIWSVIFLLAVFGSHAVLGNRVISPTIHFNT